MKLPEVSIIGIGGLGQALTRAFTAHNISVKSIFNRTENKARRLANKTSIEIAASFPSKPDQVGDLIFLTVSDQVIEKTAQRLSKIDADFQETTVVHCSGNESAALLQDLKEKGAATASFHPLQTFTPHSDSESFNGIYFSMQGDEQAFPLLEKVAGRIGAHSFQVTAEQKSHLHAAAVMASNYLNTLLDASVATAAKSGLSRPEVRKALLPLIQTTLQNIEGQTFKEALTGPIKRGDVDTVKNHLSLLSKHPELRELYCVIGRQTIEAAEVSGAIHKNSADKLRKILG